MFFFFNGEWGFRHKKAHKQTAYKEMEIAQPSSGNRPGEVANWYVQERKHKYQQLRLLR